MSFSRRHTVELVNPVFLFYPKSLAEKKHGLPCFVVPHWDVSYKETFCHF